MLNVLQERARAGDHWRAVRKLFVDHGQEFPVLVCRFLGNGDLVGGKFVEEWVFLSELEHFFRSGLQVALQKKRKGQRSRQAVN